MNATRMANGGEVGLSRLAALMIGSDNSSCIYRRERNSLQERPIAFYSVSGRDEVFEDAAEVLRSDDDVTA